LRVSHRVEDLSGGEQQRVALARALVMEPDILLADEPTGNLDQKNSESVHALIDELNKELGMTVIVVTHNNEFARMMKRNVTIMDGGIIPV
ncbi:MAG: ATP-binding cassette domain-containing protein, partial [Desulfobacteraceae bacterium]|nr:ATP-binding cassette domain-containing protein [Desulfobacteraceae bacterium]